MFMHWRMVDQAATDGCELAGYTQHSLLAGRLQHFVAVGSLGDDQAEPGTLDVPLGAEGVEAVATPYAPVFPPDCPPFCTDGGGAAVSPLLTGDGTGLAAAGIEPGGVDFSTVTLRYFTETTGDEARLVGYGFRAAPAEAPTATGATTAAATSDAATGARRRGGPRMRWGYGWRCRRTRLGELNPRAGPGDRRRPGAGRRPGGSCWKRLADEKTVAGLLHPDSELGKAYWDKLYAFVDARG
jgi:hypothetical protein